MKLKTVKIQSNDKNGHVLSITYHNMPLLSDKELNELKVTQPSIYQLIQAF